ncbi:cilia- and flagella-associated protein 74-like isoform X2 [Gigantopelta aegis]|uniref:cilia- and flagella-associated protein 74-like isoform X2 n=1 Tax=Gigantopelta aegis TaxID=1735272 RepID=UPI001B888795|nr:cilia- and flagella-associated protein 74-like isoform X2 [Gigantopelta aegis]
MENTQVESQEFKPVYTVDEDGIVDYDHDEDTLDFGSDDDSIFADDNTEAGEPHSTIPSEKITYQEQIRMIHLRSHLNKLIDQVEKRRYTTVRTREELNKCRNHIAYLENERDRVFEEIEKTEAEENVAALFRLHATHERLCKELEGEEEIVKSIRERLNEAQDDLSKAEVERNKFMLEEHDLIQKEKQLAEERVTLARIRLRKEQKHALQAESAKKHRERSEVESSREREKRDQHLMEEAARSHEINSRYLNKTLAKIRAREMEEHERSKVDMHRKMDMLLTLKNDIITNRENLAALQARNKVKALEEERQVFLEKQKILEEGGNPDEVFLIKKRLNEVEKQKQLFEKRQQENQIGILSKILMEEERVKNKKKLQPSLFHDPKREKSLIVSPHKQRSKLLTEYTKMSSGLEKTAPVRTLSPEEKCAQDIAEREDGEKDEYDHREIPVPPQRNRHVTDDSQGQSDTDEEDSVDLAKPEFEGLWDQHKPYHVPKDIDMAAKPPGASKMEKEILQKVLEKHRDGIVVKQVAAGREFSGCPFYSKPDVIHFKDFNVGRSYKKKVILTNVSYSVNYCKYIGITERLKDFIKIDFDPPGQMSAGLTCEMMVSFKPMINEDLEGEVNFVAQTGPFSIPLKCTTKKCYLVLDSYMVDFGTTVIGENLRRSFILINKGALGTKFEFYKVTGMKHGTCTTAPTSLGRLTTADTMRAMSPESSECLENLAASVSADKQAEMKKKQDASDLGKITEPGTDAETEAGVVKSDGNGVNDLLKSHDPDFLDVPGESRDFPVSEMEDFGSLDGLKVGSISSGEIGPFSSVKLDIVWQPTVPGKVNADFLVSFTDPLSEGLMVSCVANAIDVPVWVERQTVDLKICMFDRLYQDTIVANNRATSALKLKFEVCKELRNHLELLPKTGYIQAQSQFSAQLKFLPRKSLFEEGGKYFDKETGVLEAPMLISVADQAQPVPFTVTAVVTNSDIEFDVSDIDFGYSTIYESVRKSIKLTNKSILKQEFGFVGLPDYMEVQPNDGFGTLLPLETIDLDVIFSPKKAREYKFELCCKSLINRDFKIPCKGIGVHPPLELSHQVIHFAATPMYDVSTVSLHVINSHTSSNEFTHPVPRIGKGEIASVGPTSFQFVIPEDCPLTVSPTVGTVLPGQKSRIQIRFTPKLTESLIKKEAVRMATKMLEAKADREYREAVKMQSDLLEQQAQNVQTKGKSGKKSAKSAKPPAPGKGKSALQAVVTGGEIEKPKAVVPPDKDSISSDSPEYYAAIGSLLRQFKGQFKNYVIPCYVASGSCGNPGELPYSIHNTLYLEVHCPVVKPPVVVISDNGRTTLDFGDVSIGQDKSRSITVQNISNKPVELKSSILETDGPFQIVNAMRMLSADATHTAVISFTPTAGRVFHEILEIQSPNGTLYLTLTGRGVSPIVNLSLESQVVDMGAVLCNEYMEKTFKIHNNSSLSIDYFIKLDSMSLLRHSKSQGIPAFIKRDKKSKNLVGTQNHNGQCVFDLVPAEGSIEAGGSKEITITFAPDHSSENYSDGVRVDLFKQQESHCFQLIGKAKPHIMYMEGGETIGPDVESLTILPVITDEEEDFKPPPYTLFVTLFSVAKDDEFTTASRDVYVVCVRTMAVSQKKHGNPGGKKKNGEYQFENLQPLINKGFNFEPQRAMVEAGSKKPVTITWTPPAGHNPTEVVESSVYVTLKGDVNEQYRIILRAMVVSE